MWAGKADKDISAKVHSWGRQTFMSRFHSFIKKGYYFPREITKHSFSHWIQFKFMVSGYSLSLSNDDDGQSPINKRFIFCSQLPTYIYTQYEGEE